MTHSIFFDLETTDLNFCGQILNYSFIHLDDNWNIVSELSGDIRLSRLQLPSPGAILANRIDIMQHQQTVTDTEPVAFEKIRAFLERIGERHGPVPLIGYNSTRFDVPFLRTSMIRNGVNPYFGKNIEYADLLNVSQALAIENEDFQEKIGVPKIKDGFRPKLGLENLCANVFKLRDGPQSHHSREDVLWTIDLAKFYAKNYDIDVRQFCCYEPDTNGIQNYVVIKSFPAWDSKHHRENGDKAESRMALLLQEGNQALWVDIDLFKQGKRREAVFWYNKSTSPFFVTDFMQPEDVGIDLELMRLELSDITLDNYFPPKNCDIEQFIYSMKFDENKALYRAIETGNTDEIKRLGSKRASILYLRYIAAYELDNPKSDDIFDKYVMYRYGGELKLSKDDFETKFQPGVYSELFHKTYNELMDEIRQLIDQEVFKAGDDISKAARNMVLLNSLKEYYQTCEIFTRCGGQLTRIYRMKPEQVATL